MNRILGISIGLFIFLTILTSGVAVFELKYQNRFYPNVFIGEEPVGGKTYEEVREKLKGVADILNSEGFRLVFYGKERVREINVPISAQGLTSDTVVEYFSFNAWEEAARKAYEWGRKGSFWKQAREQFFTLLWKESVNLNTAVRGEAVRSFLAREIKNSFQRAVPAQFAAGASGIVILPEKIGERIDYDEIIEAMAEELKSLRTASLEFNIRPDVPSITAKDLEPFLEPVRQLAKSITGVFNYNGHKKYVSGSNFAAWLTLKDKKAGLLGVDRGKLEQFLRRYIVPLVGDPPVNSRFEVQNGKLMEIVSGKAGNIVDFDGTEQKIDRVIQEIQKTWELASLIAQASFDKKTGIITIPLEILRVDPKVTKQTIKQYEIKDLVAVARTSFRGSSADRIHNINTGVSKLTGVLIAPGEEFSAVEAIGVTTEEEGFLKEYVIKEDKSVKEAGGGLCQIATTLFRLALNAGLPITERQNHRYVVGYYGPGLDATIYGPKPDLKFINDTDQYLLLQGKVSGDELIFEFYGQKDGRAVAISDVQLSDPIPAPDTKYLAGSDVPWGEEKCSETPRAGITAEVTYAVKYANGETKEQVFKSVYQPWQKVCLIGIAR